MVMLPRVYRLATIKALPAKLFDALECRQQGYEHGWKEACALSVTKGNGLC